MIILNGVGCWDFSLKQTELGDWEARSAKTTALHDSGDQPWMFFGLSGQKKQLYSVLKFRCAIFRWTGWCETKERAMQGMKKSRKVSQGVSRSQKVKYWKFKPFYMFHLEIAVLCCRTLNSCKICNHSANSQFPYISHFSILKQANPTFSGHPCKSIFNDQEQEMLDGGYSSSSRDASVDLEKYGEKDYRKVRLIFPCIF